MADAHLTARLGLDQTGFQAGIGKAEASVNKFANQGLASFKGALAGAFSVAALEVFAQKALDVADKMVKLSAQTGISGEELQRFNNAARSSGTDIDSFASAITKLSVTMGKALKDSGDERDSFAALGVTLADLKSLSPEEVFLKIADAVKDSEDPVKTAISLQNTLGKSFKDLIPLLLEGKDGIEALKKETIGIISNDDLQRLDDLKDRLQSLGDVAKTVGTKIALFFQNLFDSVQAGAAIVANIAFANSQKDLDEHLASIGKRNLGLDSKKPDGKKLQALNRADTDETGSKKEEARLQKLSDLQQRFADAKQAAFLKELTAKDQLLILEKQRDDLENETSVRNEEGEIEFQLRLLKVKEDLVEVEKKIREERLKREEEDAKGFQDRINNREKEEELRKGKGVHVSNVITDSLQRIGGHVGSRANPALRVQERQAEIQENILQFMKEIDKKLPKNAADTGDADFGTP